MKISISLPEEIETVLERFLEDTGVRANALVLPYHYESSPVPGMCQALGLITVLAETEEPIAGRLYDPEEY